MSFSRAVKTCLAKYVTFSGRATRAEFWWFQLFLILLSVAAGILDSVFFGSANVDLGPGEISAGSEGPLTGLVMLGTFLPSLAVGWRRMHDTGRSGFYLLYPLIVMVGIGIFLSVAGVTGDILLGGRIEEAFSGLVGLVAGVAVFILAISPLLVLWWLTRPSDPETNAYGPPPPRGAP